MGTTTAHDRGIRHPAPEVREVTLGTHRLLRGAAALALGATLLAPAAGAFAAPAQSADPAQPVELTDQMSGHLVGGPAGHFAFYRFFYPADGTTATVNVEVSPDDPTILQNVGIKIYGPQPNKEYFSGGEQPGIVPNVS